MSTFQTSILSEAAYLKMRGLRVLRCFKASGGESVFEFEDQEEVAKSLTIEYLNSDFAIFDDHLRKMRSMIKSNR